MTVVKAGTAKLDDATDHPILGPYTAQLISDTGNLSQFGAFYRNAAARFWVLPPSLAQQ